MFNFLSSSTGDTFAMKVGRLDQASPSFKLLIGSWYALAAPD